MGAIHIKTPLIFSDYYSELVGTNVYLKLENLQPTGSFKARGIGVLCDHYVQSGKKHLVASSGGNAGLAVAYSARKLGVEARIFVPKTAPRTVISKIESFGAKVEVIGDVWDETDLRANEVAKELDAGYVPPFDDPKIWEGHSTIVDEISETLIPDAIACSVGGGGLLLGLINGVHRHNWLDTSLLACETEGAASFSESQKKNELIYLEKVSTIAGTLGAKHVTDSLLPHLTSDKIKSLLVSDEQALKGCVDFASQHRMIVEPACGATLSISDVYKEKLESYKNIVMIVCGGCCLGLVYKSLATL